jgi:hypothetical protein
LSPTGILWLTVAPQLEQYFIASTVSKDGAEGGNRTPTSEETGF